MSQDQEIITRELTDHDMVMSRGKAIKQGKGANMERDNIRDFVAL